MYVQFLTTAVFSWTETKLFRWRHPFTVIAYTLYSNKLFKIFCQIYGKTYFVKRNIMNYTITYLARKHFTQERTARH